MKIIQGDLLQLAADGRFDVIVHGCNCQCQMGKGIALSIKRRFPAAYRADLQTEKASRDKLGTYSQAEVSENGHAFVVVNAYTQFHWRGPGVRAEYDAIERAMASIARQFHGKRIGYPLIGAGLAGGDWSRISAIIDAALAGEDHTLVEFNG
ncbi:macro domain-containing protein [Lysobacter capsici]|uniref:macro domain-containing protein n=1 Tax=Lysobacter capsici TaxID=435897 RepID=UPI001BFFEFAC|nr:macro domain-containing protein [Lysobacter capsici]MBW8809775.1 macro domain-containing protein [Lysobacter sp.]QWF19078.1 macro domain-containing protein [Lysobacter capsici]